MTRAKKPYDQCTRKEKRLYGYWHDIYEIYWKDPQAQADLYALDARLDTPGYAFELAALRRAIRNEISLMFYKTRGDVAYDMPVHIHVTEVDDHIYPFKVRVSFDDGEFDGYEKIGVFPIGDAHSMQPYVARDDRMYRHFLWPRHEHKAR